MVKAVKDFFLSGKMHKKVNNSLIVLIPKIQNPTSFNHFRPISLCNVVYKIIAKILMNKLRPLLPKLISPCQSAFVLGRWIAENEVVVQKLLHSFKKRKVKGGFLAIKLNLQKAYDKVSRKFLQAVLLNFGFNKRFVSWIKECISFVSSAILVNGSKTASFTPSRGLRQEDPLSSYLFILTQEVLSRLIENEHREGQLGGVKMNIGGPAITHVMYADDIMLFTKAKRCETETLNKCLELYCTWSGQRINKGKSGLVFSKPSQRGLRRDLKHILQMKCLKNDAMYLGAPLFLMRHKSKDFKYLQDRLETQLKGWRSKCLSWAGRCTLIKSVAQALPTYAMSTFELPSKLCENFDAQRRRIWWNQKKENGRYLAWKAWDQLCLPKQCGGLGFRKSKDCNCALIAKLAWMVASNRDSLCMRSLRSKYKVRINWLRKDPVRNASPIWKAIENTKTLILKGACFLVGDGKSIDRWLDPWIPWVEGFKPKPKDESVSITHMMVSSLIDPNTHAWRCEKLFELFEVDFVEAIKKISIPIIPKPDRLIRIKDNKGQFSTRSAYRVSQEHREVADNAVMWQKLWKMKIHERVKMLVWRIGMNILPTKENLAQRLGLEDKECSLCHEEIESCTHLFFQCNVARAIWFGSI